MSASAEQAAEAARRGAGLFRLPHRGVVAVEGRDRVRWLDGMISGDVSSLAAGPERSGCYALVLTAKGRIVADVHVLHREDAFWLETEAEAISSLIAHLSKFIVADDVTLTDCCGDPVRLALEGPAAPSILSGALGEAIALSPDSVADVTLGRVDAVVAAFGFTAQPAFQLFAPADGADAVTRALKEAGAGSGLVEADAATFEILRVEAGTPRLLAELDESVLPAEARLERAVATDKGCYTGQEVVERLRTQGKASHLLVGLRADGSTPPEVGAEIAQDGANVGEVTSACVSPAAGAIGLGFVRRAAADPGTPLLAGGIAVAVSELPFPEVSETEVPGTSEEAADAET